MFGNLLVNVDWGINFVVWLFVSEWVFCVWWLLMVCGSGIKIVVLFVVVILVMVNVLVW